MLRIDDTPIENGTVPPGWTKALDTVCKLQGVGPATGTLVLSVFTIEMKHNVPFFEDELFEWCFPEHGKLKYNQKEYSQLCVKVNEIAQRLHVKAVELEKTAYVLKHIDTLGEEEKRKLEELSKGYKALDAKETAAKGNVTANPAGHGTRHQIETVDVKAKVPEVRKIVQNKSAKRGSEAPNDSISEQAGPLRRSKRVKQ